MRLRSGQSTTKTSGSMGKSYWKKGGKGGSSPRQLRQHGTPTCNSTGTRAVTPNSPPVGTSGASTFVGPTGTTNSSGPRLLHQHRPHLPLSPESCCCQCTCPHTKRPTTTTTRTTYPPNDDDDDIKAKLAELQAKEERRLAQRRVIRARYRARHPDRVAASKKRYRAKRHKTHLVSFDDEDDEDDDDDVCGVYDELAELHAKEERRLAQRRAERARYRVKHADRVAAYQKRYYATQAERIREHKRQFYRSEAGQRWQKQYVVRKRESAVLLRRQRGPMVQKATEEKRQALGPLKLTVTLEDFMQDFHDSLSPSPEDSVDQPEDIMDMDSGVFHPMDYSVGDESSLSSCDMWDDGKGFLDNLLDDLSSSDDSLLDLDDLSSSSDDCFFDFLTDMMEEDSSFDLDDFVS